MILNPQELKTTYRDWWGEFDPMTLALMDGINRSGCFVPRFFVAPSGGNLVQNTQAPGSYVNYVLEIPVGSFIWGIYTAGDVEFAVQVTDMGLTYKWFNTPCPGDVLLADPQGPYLFPALYPVMAPGTFMFEFYSTVATGGASILMSLTLGAAVPIEAINQ
jgi:hypothetical protein